MEYITYTDKKSNREILLTQEEIDFLECRIRVSELSAKFFREWHTTIGFMTSVDAIRYRASVKEVLYFANQLRKSGGNSDFLEELIPSEPREAKSCLIANALNFNCTISNWGMDWEMHVNDADLADKIRRDMELGKGHRENNIRLPYQIGLVAAAFDTKRDVELKQYETDIMF